MGFCLQCKKWLTQSEGKRRREFCNSTCRSNYWYAQNKKKNVQCVKPDEKAFDAPEFPSNFVGDEPLSFDKIRQEMKPKAPKTVFQYLKEKRELENPEQHQAWLEELEADPFLGKRQKDQIKNASTSDL